jgi:hypothetical protein
MREAAMTELAWLTASGRAGFWQMWQFAGDAAGARKARLLACAACRLRWDLLEDERSRAAVRGAERYADGLLGERERDRLRQAAWDAMRAIARVRDVPPGRPFYAEGSDSPEAYLAAAAEVALGARPNAVVRDVTEHIWEGVRAEEEDEPARQARGTEYWADLCRLLRELIGERPRRPIIPGAWLEWNGGTVPRLAQAIDDEGRFDDLPILADALEDAGCDNADLLKHCRKRDGHVRGCWALDLLLGKR